jgi:hypothetical protein
MEGWDQREVSVIGGTTSLYRQMTITILHNREKQVVQKMTGTFGIILKRSNIALLCFTQTGNEEKNQTARGHSTLKGWGMLRAARFG